MYQNDCDLLINPVSHYTSYPQIKIKFEMRAISSFLHLICLTLLWFSWLNEWLFFHIYLEFRQKKQLKNTALQSQVSHTSLIVSNNKIPFSNKQSVSKVFTYSFFVYSKVDRVKRRQHMYEFWGKKKIFEKLIKRSHPKTRRTCRSLDIHRFN